MNKNIKWTAYIALVFIIVFFSGLFADATGPLKALDFNNILGEFGSLGTLEEGAGSLASNFRGTGGTGVRDGFLFALTLVPAVMFSLGIVKVVEYLDGLRAAEKLLSPLLKPLLGLPGAAAIALIASLQSADAGSSITKQLSDNGTLSENQKTTFCAFQFSAGAPLTNFLGSGAALFPFLGTTPILVPLIVILIFKFIGANLMRFYLKKYMKEEVAS